MLNAEKRMNESNFLSTIFYRCRKGRCRVRLATQAKLFAALKQSNVSR